MILDAMISLSSLIFPLDFLIGSGRYWYRFGLYTIVAHFEPCVYLRLENAPAVLTPVLGN